MTDSTESGTGKINLKIKTTSTTYDVEVPEGATVSDVKRVLVDKTGNPQEKHTLIFSGKILKDADTLAQHSIKDGMAIHLVIRTTAAPAQSQPSSGTPSTPRASPAQAQPSMNPFGGAPGGGMGNAMSMLQNPEMMQQMMNSPLMQSIMSNPAILRSMLTENPQVQQLIEANPELGHMLNDPEMMRQTMEMIRNPNMFHEMMRNHDQAIRNLQGIPGGEAALQRLYNEVQEPLLNSATSSLTGNPFAALQNPNGSSPSSRSQNAGVENAEALPNPWGGGGSSSTTSTNGSSTGGVGGGLGGLGNIPGLGSSMQSMLESPGMRSMMDQILSDPSLMQQMMSPESMQAMQQMVASNPNLIDSALSGNPLFAGNPQAASEMRGAFQSFMNSPNFPEMMQAMSNPRVAEGMRLIQQGMDILRREAPQLANSMIPGGIPSGFPGAAAAGGAASGAGAAGGNAQQLAGLMNMLQGMNMGAGMGGAGAAGVQNPEERFASQLEQLQSMGFNNQAENLAALQASFGDVNAAIERLLQR